MPDVDLPRIGGTRVSATGTFAPRVSTLIAVGAGQEIFDFGRIAAETAVADVGYQIEGLRADTERLAVDLLVREAYYGVESAREIRRAAEDAFQRSVVHREMAVAVVKSGLGAPIELTRADADLTRFDVGRVRAEGAFLTAQAAFAAAVGVPERLLDTAGRPPETAAPPALEEILRRAEAQDPALREVRARVRGAELAARAIDAQLRPDLALTATFSGRAGGAVPSTGVNADTTGPLPTVPNWDVGLVLRWPLFDPIVAARRDVATSRAEVARAEVGIVAQRQTAAVEQGYVAWQVSRAALASLENALRAALANDAQAEARFKAGLGTSLELADAEALRTDAEIQLAIGQFEVRRARALLARLMAEDA